MFLFVLHSLHILREGGDLVLAGRGEEAQQLGQTGAIGRVLDGSQLKASKNNDISSPIS